MIIEVFVVDLLEVVKMWSVCVEQSIVNAHNDRKRTVLNNYQF